MMIVTEPILKLEANTAWALFQPCMSVMSLEDTPPVTIRVTARLAPCRTKKVPSVTRKLGSPVLCSNQPLNAPTAREKISAISTPVQTLRLKYHAIWAAHSPEEVTATPVDRSNSPPIIRRATKMAMMPMVEDP